MTADCFSSKNWIDKISKDEILFIFKNKIRNSIKMDAINKRKLEYETK